jgi:hypothetical protein
MSVVKADCPAGLSPLSKDFLEAPENASHLRAAEAK